MLRQPCLPTPAELARTALRASPTLEIVAGGVTATVGRHDTDRRGRPMLLVDRRSALAELATNKLDPVPMLVWAASLRPVELPDRVRARVELSGYLDTVCPMRCGQVQLRGEVLAVTLDGARIDPDAYARAASDPHVDDEAALLRTLLRNRPAALARACARLEPELVAAATAIAPSGLDRHGVTVWLGGPGWARELRLPFPEPLDDPGAAASTVAALLDAAASGRRPCPRRRR